MYVQEHVLELLHSEGVTGFATKPVTAQFEHEADSTPPRLFELVVTGWGGVAPERSGIKLEERCPACGLLTYSAFRDPSQLIERSQWDGSDLFIVWPLPKFIFVTERVARIFRSNELTGATLQCPNELTARGGSISPGRFSYRMPEARAIELAAHLGIA